MINTSNNMLFHLGNLNAENRRISYSMATGDKIDKGSEDAMLHSKLISIEDNLRVTISLETQLVKTNVVNETADSALATLKEELDAIKVDLMKALNSGMQRSDKLAVATNLTGIRDNIYDMINVKVDNEYVFTGSVTTKQTLVKDIDFKDNGKVDFGGDGFLRKIAVQPGSYRDRGVTAYDAVFYANTSARTGEEFTFQAGERVIDSEGFEWKLNEAKTFIQQYDHNGKIYHPPRQIPINSNTPEVAAWNGVAPEPTDVQPKRASYTITAMPNVTDTSATPSEKADISHLVFEAKHNFFDDLNVIINALEGHLTNLDGTKGAVINDENVRKTLSSGLEITSRQFDSTNIGHGELGGRNKVFEVAYERLLTKKTHYKILLEDMGSANKTELAMESKSLELTYQALYATIAKMNNLSLVNFIK